MLSAPYGGGAQPTRAATPPPVEGAPSGGVPMTTDQGVEPMRPDDPMRLSGARWCTDHERWECAKPKKSGAACHGSAIAGMPRCRMHAGLASQLAKAQGAANLAAWSVTSAMEQPPRDPGAVVMAALEMSIMRVQILGELLRIQVADQDYDGLVGRTHAAGRDGARVETGEQPRGLAKMERDERVLMVQFAKTAHDMGIAERVIELHQGQAQLVVSAFVAGLAAVPTLLPGDKDLMLRTFLSGLGRGPGSPPLPPVLEGGSVTP